MLENICIIHNEKENIADIGLIAESLLFYDTVHLVASMDTIPLLLQHCEVSHIKDLVQSDRLKIYYRENHLGAFSMKMPDGREVNDVPLISSPNHSLEYYLYRSFFLASKRKGYSRRMTRKLIDLFDVIKYDSGISDVIRGDLDQESYVKESIVQSIKFFNPDCQITPDDFDYRKTPTKQGFFFETDLNFDEINHSLKIGGKQNKILSNSSFILNIQEVRGDMQLASKLDSDLLTSELRSNIIKLKFSSIFEQTESNQSDIHQFCDVVLDEGNAIREAVNSKEKKFVDFLKLLAKADKFREWKTELSDNTSILKEYYKQTTEKTWIERLPGKGFRWSVFTGLGIAANLISGGLGTAIGLALNAGDTFLVDRTMKGWKPNAFIDKDLKRYLK
jgi:hypothetical protein